MNNLKKRSMYATHESQKQNISQIAKGKYGTIVIQNQDQIALRKYRRHFGRLGDWISLQSFRAYAQYKRQNH